MKSKAKPLPAPRLQLRWVKRTAKERKDGNGQYMCHYELVLPLAEDDIRREVWEDGKEVGQRAELAIEINATYREGGIPCQSMDGARYFDAPYRDGAHATWDAKVLGDPPIYVIAPDGEVFVRDEVRPA